MNKKEKLIKALEEEKEHFDARGHDTLDHNLAISYLKTGKVPAVNVWDHDLLHAAVHDFDMLCKDYGAED